MGEEVCNDNYNISRVDDNDHEDDNMKLIKSFTASTSLTAATATSSSSTSSSTQEVGLIPPELVVRCDDLVDSVFAVAISSFEGIEEFDLSFLEGDQIEIVQDHYLHQRDLCVGKLRGSYGVFDAEMVSLIEV